MQQKWKARAREQGGGLGGANVFPLCSVVAPVCFCSVCGGAWLYSAPSSTGKCHGGASKVCYLLNHRNTT